MVTLDPDVNFFQNISSLDTQYLNIDDTKTFVNINISSILVQYVWNAVRKFAKLQFTESIK